MRNTFFLLLFLISGACFSQNPDPFWDGIRTKLVQPDTLSTFDRDALTPKLGTILYHKDTGVSRWEKWDGTAWVEFGAGSEYTFSDTSEIDFTLTGNDVTADIVSGSIDETKLDASVNASLDLADSALQSVPTSPIENKKWTIFGDSFSSTLVDPDYTYYVIQQLGLTGTETNAVSGDLIWNQVDDLDALLLSDPTYFDDFDICSFLIGVNDYRNDYALGDISSASGESNFSGQLKYFIETVLTANPEIELFLISPPETDQVAFPYKSANANGDTLSDFSVLMGEIAASYSVQFIDLNKLSGFNLQTISSFTIEGLHPNSIGAEVIANIIANGFITSNNKGANQQFVSLDKTETVQGEKTLTDAFRVESSITSTSTIVSDGGILARVIAYNTETKRANLFADASGGLLQLQADGFTDSFIRGYGNSVLNGGSLTVSGTVRGANNSGINGTSTGSANVAYNSFYESNGTTRQGYIGFSSGSNNHLYIRNDVSGKQLLLLDTDPLTYNGPAEFTGTVSGSDPVNADDFVTKGYAESNFSSPMTVIDKVLSQTTFTTVGTDVTLYDFNNAALQLASDGDFFEFKFMFTYSGSTSNTLRPTFQYGGTTTTFSTQSNVVSGDFSVDGYGVRKTDDSVSVYFTTRLAPSGYEYSTVIDNATSQSRLRVGYTASAATSITLKTGYIKKYSF